MCDYSLESVKSRAAESDEDLVVKAFGSGSKGFISASDPDCAVCCKAGVEMTLHLNATLQTRELVKGEPVGSMDEEFAGDIPVTFHTLAKLTPQPWGGQSFGYKDGFMLPNGRYLSLQRLSPGTQATVTKALPKEITEAVKGGVASKDDIEVRVADVAPLVTATVD